MSKKFFNEKTAQTIEIVQTVFNELDITAYLIGAQARDIWFLPKQLPRFTKDIDWIVADSKNEVFKELKNKLINENGFSETSNPIKLTSPNGIEVDLIPFDYVEMPHLLAFTKFLNKALKLFFLIMENLIK